MKKTIIFIIIALLAITLGVIAGTNINNKDKQKEVISENIANAEQKDEKVISQNNTIDNIDNEKEDNTIENEIKEEPKTDLDKAKDIVKKVWGEDDNSVYFSQDSINEDGSYIICVRDKSTTSALAWYQVNINTEVCEELIDW